MRRYGGTYEDNGIMDMFQLDFISFEKSLIWQECKTCHKRVILPCYQQMKCGRYCHYLFTKDNNMDPGIVPNELTGLTYIEKQLICRVHPVFSVYKVNRVQYKYKGQVINFPQNVQTVADKLPHLVADLNNLVVVKLTSDVELKDFYVRKDKVLNALCWLKANNPLYNDVVIDYCRIAALPDEGNVFNDLSNLVTDPSQSQCEDSAEYDGDIFKSSGVPEIRDPSLNNTLNNCLLWPQIGNFPINEFGNPGYLTLAFPHLFPYSDADYSMPRKHKIPLPLYVQHLMQYKYGRFANDERFRYFMMNTEMSWNEQGKVLLPYCYCHCHCHIAIAVLLYCRIVAGQGQALVRG
ncbi:Cysteine--tRNA ligase [Frankliniella fusca]|uniref:Cysteine--tRNA ligase n=1 Tax=Frankliniella fusca TaxID=407009 RepID=A0AAE1LFA6_9NEOP|nr:Cysteine--tRNA ligase [Frankliniella fusca]